MGAAATTTSGERADPGGTTAADPDGTTGADRADPDGTTADRADPDGTTADPDMTTGQVDLDGTRGQGDTGKAVSPRIDQQHPHRKTAPANAVRRPGRCGFVSVLLDPEHRVDLVAHHDTAGIGVGLGRIEVIHHIGVADPVLQVDETE
jgi:hypothetical protein